MLIQVLLNDDLLTVTVELFLLLFDEMFDEKKQAKLFLIY